MFANRAIELQAQGTYVLSNYNVGLNSRYPHVHISNGFTDTLAALENLTETQLRQNQAAGIRSVFSHDLAIMRIAKIIETVGLEATVANPRVQVIKHGHDEQLAHQLAEQTYANVVDVAEAADVETLAERATHSDMVVHVDTAHDYDPTHIEDLVNAFRYTDAQTVEKIPQNSPDQSGSIRHRYAEPVNVTSIGAEFVGQIPPSIKPQAGYHIDNIGVSYRQESITVASTASAQKPSILSVVVPVYNNGPHLLHKCIASLRRSSIFDQMEIVLVADGSTDLATGHAIDQLAYELAAVKVYRFEQGGSGSASRPRNKGLELASCSYVTYLDPDNEALNDAYVKLLHTAIEAGVDFAVGDMTRWRGTNSAVRYTRFLQKRLGMEPEVASGGAQALVDMEFMPISIQAVVARTDWLRATGISQPVGAVGQDSYFFQQMLYYADTFAIVPI